MVANNRLFKSKNFFVTGADGFIGSHLCSLLVKSGANVKALVCYNSWSSIGWLGALPKDVLDCIEIVNGDVRDAQFLSDQFHGTNYVMHLASLIAIPYSYQSPRSYIDTNVGGTLNVLEASQGCSTIERVLHVSTSETYGSAQFVPITEEHPLVGQSPYAASKIAADKLAESFACSFDFPVVIARPFNTYGPRQTARAIIPTVLSQLAYGCKEIRLGSLQPTRDFNYVEDTVRGMCEVLVGGFSPGEVVNIGSGSEISIGDLVKLAMEVTGVEASIFSDSKRERPEASEVNRLLADSSKLRKCTGWSPQTDLRAGLWATYLWIKKNMHLFDPSVYQK